MAQHGDVNHYFILALYNNIGALYMPKPDRYVTSTRLGRSMDEEQKITPPPRWDLSPVFPAFAGLDATDKKFEIYQSVKKRTDKALAEFQPVLDKLPEITSRISEPHASDNEELASAKQELEAALVSTIGLLETVSRMQLFLQLYEQEHYRDPDAQEFIKDLYDHTNQLFSPINKVVGQLPIPSGATPDIDGLIATYPTLSPLRAFWSVAEERVDFRLDREDGLLVLAASAGIIDDDPKEKSPYNTFAYLNGNASNAIGRLERAYTSASMFNAKMHERWTIARVKGSTPQAMYEQDHGLPTGFMDQFFADTYTDTAESIDTMRLAHSSASATVRYDVPKRDYTWDETVNIAMDAFDWMSPELGAMARKAIEEGWINAEHEPNKFPTPNARPGVGTNRTSSDHPYINAWSESKEKVGGLTWVEIIVHELAHAIAFQLEIDANGEALNNPLLQETIAHTAQKVALNRMISQEQDEKQHACIMRHEIDGFEKIFNGQQKFEHLLYDATKEKDFTPLTPEAIAQCYRDAAPGTMHKYARDSYLLNTLSNWTHYINNAPYSMSDYTFAECAAHNIYQKLEADKAAGRTDTIDTWIDCMRNCSNTSFGQAMERLGIEPEHLTDSIPAYIERQWEKIEVTAKKIDEDIMLKNAEERRNPPKPDEAQPAKTIDDPEAEAKQKADEAKRLAEREKREEDLMSLAKSVGVVKSPDYRSGITSKRQAADTDRQR